MRLMAGLDAPSAGRLMWHDRDVTGVQVQDRKVAMVYPQFINYPAMSVHDNNLDIDNFIGVKFTTALDGELYQLPDQQFANLYWFCHDWLTDPNTMEHFNAKYGYDLGVPRNWSACEDIAEFFTGRDMSHTGGPASRVYGDMDYGKKDPSLGWRHTDAWRSMAGMGDKGEPNGLPVDEWGTGTNIPDCPNLAQLWSQNIGDAMSRAKTPQEAPDSLCAEQEKVLERLERAGVQGDIGPKLNEEQDPRVWLDEPGSPAARLENEARTPETISHDELIKPWQQADTGPGRAERRRPNQIS